MYLLDVFAERAVIALSIAFLVSFIVELAFVGIFAYKPISKFLEGKHLKFPIVLASCLAITFGYPFDVFGILFDKPDLWVTQVLSALMLAGGSAKIAEKLGYLRTSIRKVA
jgi:hypothetical protein